MNTMKTTLYSHSERNLYLPFLKSSFLTTSPSIWSKRFYCSSIELQNHSRIYTAAFQMIEENDVDEIPVSGFGLLEVIPNRNELGIKIEHHSKDNPDIKACWIGSKDKDFICSRPYHKILSVYLTGGKRDPGKEMRTETSVSYSFPKPVQVRVNLNLKIFAKIVKEQNDKFDRDAEVVFKMIYPEVRLNSGKPGDRSELVRITKRSFHEVAKIKFSDFIALAEDKTII